MGAWKKYENTVVSSTFTLFVLRCAINAVLSYCFASLAFSGLPIMSVWKPLKYDELEIYTLHSFLFPYPTCYMWWDFVSWILFSSFWYSELMELVAPVSLSLIPELKLTEPPELVLCRILNLYISSSMRLLMPWRMSFWLEWCLLQNVEDTDEMFDDLFNKHGKVVFRRNDQKPPSAEVDDDAESLSCKLILQLLKERWCACSFKERLCSDIYCTSLSGQIYRDWWCFFYHLVARFMQMIFGKLNFC